MKKVEVVMFISLLVLGVALIGCGSKEKQKETIATISKVESEEKEMVTVPEMEKVWMQINSVEEYRENVIAKNFLLDNEVEFLKEKGFNIITSDSIAKYASDRNEVDNYYYPIISLNEEEFWIWYTSDTGEVYRYSLDNDTISKEGKLHYESNSEGVVEIQKEKDFTLTYNKSKGEIQKWIFTEPTKASVPANSYWAGNCREESHFFRSGSDIYRFLNADASVRKVAYEVRRVVDCNYFFDKDKGLNPLFQMRDGSLKIYWNDKLYDILIEGGYHS